VKKLFSFLSMLCLLNLLVVGGLLGYLIATQRVDKAKAVVIADLLRHQGTPENLRAQVVEILGPPATAPATGPASRPVAQLARLDGPATAEERIDFARQAMEQERLRLELEAQDLRHRQELLERLQASVEASRKKVDDDRKAFEQAVALTSNKTTDESFQKTMALYDELKPRQLKDLFIPMGPDLAAKYLGAMEPDRAAKIVSEFKTPDEKTFLSAVLAKLRGTGTPNALTSRTAASPGVPALAAPAAPAAASARTGAAAPTP
jgi:flagellar motility protein MotE (MotC chaperone)